MSRGKQIFLALILEFVGSIMLGAGQSIFRVRTAGLVFFPFFSWGIYSTCYRVTGAHLNPVISLISLIRPDKGPNFSAVACILYIPLQ